MVGIGILVFILFFVGLVFVVIILGFFEIDRTNAPYNRDLYRQLKRMKESGQGKGGQYATRRTERHII